MLLKNMYFQLKIYETVKTLKVEICAAKSGQEYADREPFGTSGANIGTGSPFRFVTPNHVASDLR